jgi:hypothetical protein
MGIDTFTFLGWNASCNPRSLEHEQKEKNAMPKCRAWGRNRWKASSRRSPGSFAASKQGTILGFNKGSAYWTNWKSESQSLPFVLGFPPSKTLSEISREEIDTIINVFTLKETWTIASFHSQQSCREEVHAEMLQLFEGVSDPSKSSYISVR